MDRRKLKETFLGGIIKNNPTFVLVLGTCPTIAMTTSLFQAFAMGVATMFVLVFSNLFVSLLRNLIPDKVRIPCYIVIISTFVIIVQMVMQRYLPDLYSTMNQFITLIVVNCIILARAESFASKNGVLPSAVDGICQGIGYTLVLLVMSAIRELLGSGTLAGNRIFPAEYGALMMVLPVGGFLTLGCLIALMQWAQDKAKGGK